MYVSGINFKSNNKAHLKIMAGQRRRGIDNVANSIVYISFLPIQFLKAQKARLTNVSRAYLCTAPRMLNIIRKF